MKFRTEINIPKSKTQFEHCDKILTLGSCFAENISQYFNFYKFSILENPFGVLYNPVSIYNSLKFTVEDTQFVKEDLIYDQSEYHSFFHHSDFSHHDVNECLQKINNNFKITNKFLKSCDKIIITFGTSFVFKHKEKNIIVSNCHKIPQSEFERFRLTVEETKNYLQKIINQLQIINDKLKIIFTVSPVRHWKDGAVDNQISKAILLLAVNEIVNKNDNCTYFPSYEIMMDDLRDYRFYAEDLIHPNKIAVEYIWEKFSEIHFTESCFEIMNEVKKIAQAFKHRPRNINSEKHKEFIKANIELINKLTDKFPHLNFENELKYFNSIL
ncbi:MAG: hypothetical protein A2068_04585 [Ignavibacteria bacterium GWB2_35_6b]|nr:MAG: hypothetical protein A2068_04585 [Ignavibacteria bacterium GWB2_35_6b]